MRSETEIVQIVATAPAYGKNCGNAWPRLPLADTLLIVETLGRHICLKDGPKAPMSTPTSMVVVTGQRQLFGRFLQNPRRRISCP